MRIQNDNNFRFYNTFTLKTVNFKGANLNEFPLFFDEFCHSVKVSDNELVRLFPGKLNTAKKFLDLEDYSLSFIIPLKEKNKKEFEYLYNIASKKDLSDTLRIPADKILEFAEIATDKLKDLEPIILSKRDIGIWNYPPDLILRIARLDSKRLNTFIELAKCNVLPYTTLALLEDDSIKWDKVVQKAKELKEFYGKDLREVEFYNDTRGDTFFLADIQQPHCDNKPDWFNYKRITVKVDDDMHPVARKKLNTNIDNFVENIYAKVSEKLQIFTEKDLDNTIEKIKSECPEATEKEILIAIQKLTQFASYRSLKNIEKKLNELGITELASFGELYKYFKYFQKERELFSLKESSDIKRGVIISSNDLNNKELMGRIKAYKNVPELKELIFINLEGFSDGVNLFNDNEKLADLAIKQIKEAKKIQEKNKNLQFNDCIVKSLNDKIEKPLKNIGMQVYTLNSDSSPTKANILEQMRPVMPTKELLHSTIETIADSYTLEKNSYKKLSKDIAKYYDANVNIYSKQTIINDLKQLNKKIVSFMEKNNLPKENIYIIKNTEDDPKSFDIISKMYKELFNTPGQNIIRVADISDINSYPENSTFLIIDDIAGTGESMAELANYYKDARNISKKQHVIFAPITTTKYGINNIEKYIKENSREDSDKVIYLEKNVTDNIYYNNIFDNLFMLKKLKKIKMLSKKGYENQALCTAFPYMAPDNNSFISSFLVNLFLPSSKCIKSMPDGFKALQENSIYYNIFGQKKNNLNKSPYNEQPPSFIQKIKDFFKG